MPFGSPVPDESAFTSNIANFCLWHSNRVPFCSLNMNQHGNKIEEKHPVHHVRNNRIWPWEIPALEWKAKKKKKRQAEQAEDLWDQSVGYLSGMWSWGFQITGFGVFLSHIWFERTCLSHATPLNDAERNFWGSKPSECQAPMDSSHPHCSRVMFIMSERSRGPFKPGTPIINIV